MNKQFSVARGIVRLEDLESGSLFIFEGAIILKTSYQTLSGSCKCFIVEDGREFLAGSPARYVNNLMVQRAFLSDI